MLKHPTVTLTGLTQEDQIRKALVLSNIYDFLEWGILYSPTRIGGRYAAASWIMNNETVFELPRKALHLCGQAIPLFLFNNFLINDLIQKVQRVQLNFNIVKTPIDLARLNDRIQQFPNVTFITQHNNSNSEVYKSITASNHAVLFDQSGGNGVSPDKWRSPLKGKICGYAGGLGPENVTENLQKIIPLNNNQEFWIDMESKLRVDDKLDFDKCEQVLGAVKQMNISPNADLIDF